MYRPHQDPVLLVKHAHCWVPSLTLTLTQNCTAKLYRIIEMRSEKRPSSNPEARWNSRPYALVCLGTPSVSSSRWQTWPWFHQVLNPFAPAWSLEVAAPPAFGTRPDPPFLTLWALHEHRYQGKENRAKGLNSSFAFHSSVAWASFLISMALDFFTYEMERTTATF